MGSEDPVSIELRDIGFRYGRVEALRGVSFALGRGATGLLGPNGAGKSTLLRILLGFLRPDTGGGRVLGYDIVREQAQIRRRVGYMPEDDCLLPGMDAVTFTSHLGELSGMPRQEAMKRAHEVLFYVGLGESRYRLLDTYSGGMKQRLKLAQALVHDPRLLFLDEPTANLDPRGRQDILELIADIASNKNIQVVISSHVLSDIESSCSRVVILNKGRVAAQGLLADLRQEHFNLYELRVKGRRREYLEKLAGLGCRIEETEDGLLRVFVPVGLEKKAIFRLAAEENIQVRHFFRSRTSLEDLFARTVGGEA
ncbi:MAG: ABC transporter ATP-binding protein [Candidatus Aminicenantes bacterium]|nr:ABC transporter ATP-binding protein [Candidatus Aminicenantes bacterium]